VKDKKNAVLKELKRLHDRAETGEQWSVQDFGGLNLQRSEGEEYALRKYIAIAIAAVKEAK